MASLFYWTGAVTWLLIAVGACFVLFFLLQRASLAWMVAGILSNELSRLEGHKFGRRKLWLDAFRAGPDHEWIVMGESGERAAIVWPGSSELTAWRNIITPT